MHTRVAPLIGIIIAIAAAQADLSAPAQALGQTQGQTMEPVTAEIQIHADHPGAVIAPEIYGQFAEHLGRCIYEGIWVGPDSPIPNTRGIRNDVVAALKNLHVPVLRWPGGCFADEYHWREGIGPMDKRPRHINTHWGMVVEDNHFGTHEFLDLCEMIGCEPYICGNVGSGTPQEMMEWVEYMTSDSDSTLVNLRRQNGRDKPWKIKYFGVGNESWGCGGNMRPEYYADEYRRYATFVKNYPGSTLYKIACGPNSDDYNWTDVVMDRIGPGRMNGLSLHYYTIPNDWSHKGAATGFPASEWDLTIAHTLHMEELLTKHLAIMNKHDPKKKVGLVVDEWGTWYDQEPGSHPGFLYQQNSIRDAVVAGINLNLFNNHADRISMANIAQMVNVLQAMILTDKEKLILTPTYHVFEMFKVHQGATLLPTEVAGAEDYEAGGKKIASVYASASKDAQGRIHLSLVNARPDRAARVMVKADGTATKKVTGRVLAARKIDAHNTFEKPDEVKPAAVENAEVKDGRLVVTLPAGSVTVLEIE
jgi:alpha-N-arabinofuranosidase